MRRFAELARWVVLLGALLALWVVRVRMTHTAQIAIEVQLKTNLGTMRDALREYERDSGRLPGTLLELEAAGYLYAIPIDPSTNAADWLVVRAEDGTVQNIRSRTRSDL